MGIKFDNGSASAGGFDNVSARNSARNKVMFFRAPKETDESGQPIKASKLFYVLRLMNWSTDRRTQPFIRKFEHEAWKLNSEGKREFAGRITCLRSTYMQRELRLPHGAKAKDLCPMCRYAETKFLAAKNSNDRTLFRQAGDAEARESVYGVAYVIQDPNFKTSNGTLRVFNIRIPRVKKANRGKPIAYGICDELIQNMNKRGISVMNPDGTSKTVYDLFCEVISKEMAKGEAANPPYHVFNGGYGVDLGIRVKHVEIPDSAPYYGPRDLITDIVFASKNPHAINEIDPEVSDESLTAMVEALDFDENFMHVDSIDDIRDFCDRFYDLSATSADAFDDSGDDSVFGDPAETAPAPAPTPAVEPAGGFDDGNDEQVPVIKPTAAPKPAVKAAPKKVESKSFDEIMEDVDGTPEDDDFGGAEESAPAPEEVPADDDEMPF